MRQGEFAKVVQVVPSIDGRDRWLAIRRNSIMRAWKAPKWLSLRSWLWKRRGGC